MVVQVPRLQDSAIACPPLFAPFFADQFMWGEMVHRAGAGPEPCPVKHLNAEILVEKFLSLQDSKIRETVQNMAALMNEEDGIEGGLSHYLEHFPRHSLYSDVGLLMGQYNFARYKLHSSHIKICTDVAAVVNANNARVSSWAEVKESIATNIVASKVQRNNIATYAVGNVTSAAEGFRAGLFSIFSNVFNAVLSLHKTTDRWARSYGACGCLIGLFLAPFSFVWIMLHAFVYSFDRILTGIYNGHIGNENILHVIRLGRGSLNKLSPAEKKELQGYTVTNMPQSKQNQLKLAMDDCEKVESVFKKCHPFYPTGHFHYQVVRKVDLQNILKKKNMSSFLTGSFASNVVVALESYGKSEVSFSQFCMIIHSQTPRKWEDHSRSTKFRYSRQQTFAQIYLANTGGSDDDLSEEGESKNIDDSDLSIGESGSKV